MRTRTTPLPLPPLPTVAQEFQRQPDYTSSTNARDLARVMANCVGVGPGTHVLSPDPVGIT